MDVLEHVKFSLLEWLFFPLIEAFSLVSLSSPLTPIFLPPSLPHSFTHRHQFVCFLQPTQLVSLTRTNKMLDCVCVCVRVLCLSTRVHPHLLKVTYHSSLCFERPIINDIIMDIQCIFFLPVWLRQLCHVYKSNEISLINFLAVGRDNVRAGWAKVGQSWC